MATKKLIAVAVAFLMISAPALVFAGSKGFSGSRGSSAFKSRPAPGSSAVKPGDQGQSQTGTIRDLGVNPSTKSPADMVKNRPETPAGMAPGAGPVPQSAAPGFFGSGGGFGSSWMTWGFLGICSAEAIQHRRRGRLKKSLSWFQILWNPGRRADAAIDRDCPLGIIVTIAGKVDLGLCWSDRFSASQSPTRECKFV